ncbi:hypothetical protein [Brachyspira pilosicoli]
MLPPSYIPPPTAFPNISEEVPDYPTPTPIPPPPEITEDIHIEIKPEIVQNGTVFGGYGRRFKYKNEWYVLATNEYEYKPETKTLNPTGKGALLKIGSDGTTITKIHSLSLDEDVEEFEYWTNLNSKKLIIEENKLSIPSKSKQRVECFDTYPRRLEVGNFYYNNLFIFGCYRQLFIYIQNR